MPHKFLSSVSIFLLLFTVSAFAENHTGIGKPAVQSNGRFVPTRSDVSSADFQSSENGRYWCQYKIHREPGQDWGLKDFTFYENSEVLYTLPYLPAKGVTISNAGYCVFSRNDENGTGEIILYFLSKTGKTLLSNKVKSPDLFGFSSAGNKYGVGSHGKFEIISLQTGTIETYPVAHTFTISPDESIVALANAGVVTLFSDGKEISKISADVFWGYIRDIKFSPDNNTIAFIGKNKLFAYSLPGCRLKFADVSKGVKVFRELRMSNETLWAGIHDRARGKRVSQGILKTYDLLGRGSTEEVGDLREYAPKEKLNYEYKKNSHGVAEVPWPLDPFDEAHIQWNGYLALSAPTTGTSGAYLHQGLDMHVTKNDPCYSVADGYVRARLTTSTPENIYWRVCISEDNTSDRTGGWMYAHLIQSTIQVGVGEQVSQGDHLADIIEWVYFNDGVSGHLHFSRIMDHGTNWSFTDDEWWNAWNPLMALRPHDDNSAPSIEDAFSYSKFGFSKNTTGSNYSYLQPDDLQDDVDILVKIINKEGSGQWEMPAFSIYYWITFIETGDSIVPRTIGQIRNQTIDHYTSGDYDALAPIMFRVDQTFKAKGWFDNNRVYCHNITNNNGDSAIERSEKSLCLETADYGDGDYRIYVEASDAAGNTTLDSQDVYFNNGVTNTLSKKEKPVTDYSITHTYGNTVNSTIRFTFALPEASPVSLRIFDLNGREIKTVASKTYSAGRHSVGWNGTSALGEKVHTGIYLYKFQCMGFSKVQRLVYCK